MHTFIHVHVGDALSLSLSESLSLSAKLIQGIFIPFQQLLQPAYLLQQLSPQIFPPCQLLRLLKAEHDQQLSHERSPMAETNEISLV